MRKILRAIGLILEAISDSDVVSWVCTVSCAIALFILWYTHSNISAFSILFYTLVIFSAIASVVISVLIQSYCAIISCLIELNV